MESEAVGREGSGSLCGPLAASLLLHVALLGLIALGLPRTVPEPVATLQVRLVSLETDDAGGFGAEEGTAQGSPTGAGAGSLPAPAGAAPVARPQAPPPAQPLAPPAPARSAPHEPLSVEGMKEKVAEPSLPSPVRLEAADGPLIPEEVIPRKGAAVIENAAPAAPVGSVPEGGLGGEGRGGADGTAGAFGGPKGEGPGLGGPAGGREGGAAGAGGPGGGGAFAVILRRIEAAKQYPEQARRFGHRGTVAVRFRIGPDGRVAAAEVAVSSGSSLLDAASLETVRRAAPLPALPGWLRVRISYGLADARP